MNTTNIAEIASKGLKLGSVKKGLLKTFGPMMGKVKAKSPGLLLASGLILGGTTLALAIRATWKARKVVGEELSLIEELKQDAAEEKMPIAPGTKYGEEIKEVKISLGIQLIKLYAPAAVTGALSVVSIVGGYKILSGRNAALIGLLAASEEAFRRYKEQNPARTETIEYVDENLEKSMITTTTDVDSIYGFDIDFTYRFSSDNLPIRVQQLKAKEQLLDDIFKAQGYMFLNRVRDEFHLPPTEAGAVTGWIRREDGGGDDYIDIGIFRRDEYGRRHVRDDVVITDNTTIIHAIPNVDGYILDKLENIRR